jgi:hypothetical protein
MGRPLGVATIAGDKKLYQRRIEAADAEAEALVHELYGLTEEEIAIVEARTLAPPHLERAAAVAR